MQKEFEYIREYCGKKSIEIAKVLTEKYNEADFESDSVKIESEIYDISLCYAKVFFFEEKQFFSAENREEAKTIVRALFDVKDKKLEKMSDIELLAHQLSLYVSDTLYEDHGIML